MTVTVTVSCCTVTVSWPIPNRESHGQIVRLEGLEADVSSVEPSSEQSHFTVKGQML